MAVIIVIMLGILAFYNPAKGPVVPGGIGNASSTEFAPLVSPDGHVTVLSPEATLPVSSPVIVQGVVNGGGWFFEASFPVKVVDANGKAIGQGTAQPQAGADWMSTGTVPFTATVTFAKPDTATGTIVLSKDNPSGLPANSESFSIPISFAVQATSAGLGTVQGKVILGPTCPTEKIPPDPACAPKPYQASIAISSNIENPQGAVLKIIASDASGTFTVSLPAGEYSFLVQSAAKYPVCTGTLVDVLAGKTSTTTINCDSGIR